MTASISEKFGLGPIAQVAYVVNDMEKALETYGAVYGPFESYTAKLEDCTIRGKQADCTLHVAICAITAKACTTFASTSKTSTRRFSRWSTKGSK